MSNILRGGITNSNNLGAAGVMTTNTGMMEGMNNSNHSTPELTFAQKMALPGGTMSTGDISVDASPTSTAAIMKELPISVARHLPLLQPNSTDGAVLRSYYELSTNDVLNLPPIPTDEEYLDRLSTSSSLSSNTSNGGKLLLPTFDQSALRAARFAEIALGALANEQISLARELINACAVCLRDCVNSPAHPSCMYDVSRAYFLLGVIHSFRGDMLRYFKYRRVCMNFIQKLEVSACCIFTREFTFLYFFLTHIHIILMSRTFSI